MTCNTVKSKLSDGREVSMIVCGRGVREEVTTCFYCFKPNTKLCDFVIAPAAPGKNAVTCDRRLCGNCARTVDLDVDYCCVHEVESGASRGGRK